MTTAGLGADVREAPVVAPADGRPPGHECGEQPCPLSELASSVSMAVDDVYQAEGAPADEETAVVVGRMGRVGVFLRMPAEMIEEWQLRAVLDEAAELIDSRIDEQMKAYFARLGEQRQAAAGDSAASTD